jgi:hypothetical protein
MKKLFALFLLAGSAALAIPAFGSSSKSPDLPGGAPDPSELDSHCCPACAAGGGTCYPGPGTLCTCKPNWG